MSARYVPKVGDRVELRGVVTMTAREDNGVESIVKIDGEWVSTGWVKSENLRPEPQPVGEPYWVVECVSDGAWLCHDARNGKFCMTNRADHRNRDARRQDAIESLQLARALWPSSKFRLVKVTRTRVGGGR